MGSFLQRACWEVTIKDLKTSAEEKLYPKFLISAVGQLNVPKFPNIQGLESFQGELMHTALWKNDVRLSGKRIGVIGTGASAIQLVPPTAKVDYTCPSLSFFCLFSALILALLSLTFFLDYLPFLFPPFVLCENPTKTSPKLEYCLLDRKSHNRMINSFSPHVRVFFYCPLLCSRCRWPTGSMYSNAPLPTLCPKLTMPSPPGSPSSFLGFHC